MTSLIATSKYILHIMVHEHSSHIQHTNMFFRKMNIREIVIEKLSDFKANVLVVHNISTAPNNLH